MKSLLLSFVFLFTILIGNAQIIDIPDAVFKDFLVNYNVYTGNSLIIDTNDDEEIQVSEAEAITTLYVFNMTITSFEGLENFVNLENLTLADIEFIGDLTIENLPNLENFDIYGLVTNTISLVNLPSLNYMETTGNNPGGSINVINFDSCNCDNIEHLGIKLDPLSSIDLTSLTNLKVLILQGLPNLNEFNAFNNVNLESISITETGIAELDLSYNSNLTSLHLSGIMDYLNLKNNNTPSNFYLGNLDINYICADDSDLDILQTLTFNSNPVINSYCSFVPGGSYYVIEGSNKLNLDLNGCSTGDYLYPYLRFDISNGSSSGTLISDASGSYSIPVSEGTHTITPVFENPNYFSASPNSLTIDFPSEANPYLQDFCITPIGVYKDIELSIIPLTPAVPGFEASYRITYKNTGNSIIEFGQIMLTNDFDLMTEVEFIPSWDSFTTTDQAWHFNYSDLYPFESRTINFTMEINTPTDTSNPVNDGDILTFDVNHFIEYDVISDSTILTLNQTVFNSYDPNDIKCLEGETISPVDVGKYVHYLIRFENLGTANATNIVVKNTIDVTKFDINTLIPLNGSYDYYTRINPDNDVEFIFENIQLPFDDANNDGYVLYKIKTLESLVLGDEFSNQAEIYFDFNAPIFTNNYITEIAEDNLSTSGYSLSTIKVYPNPVTNILNIKATFTIDALSVYDMEGRKVLEKLEGHTNQLNMSALEAGIYFLNVFLDSKTETIKIIKH